MTYAQVGSLSLAYETFGESSSEPLLLVMGLGGPMIWWEDGFCQQLAEAGFFVIRYDNRDTGRSARAQGRVPLRRLATSFLGLPTSAPYSISDLAADAVGILDHLQIDRAHLVGMSMGGMIAQTIAIEHPSRVLSLTSIMSTTGARRVGWQAPAVLPTLLTPARGEEGYVRNTVKIWNLIGSPAYVGTVEAAQERARTTWAYGVSAAGTARQMLAVLTQPDRTSALRRITVPTLVIHGLADRMVHVSGGRATSMAIPGSELLLIKGMGHDLPEPLWPTYIAAIKRTAARARPDAG